MAIEMVDLPIKNGGFSIWYVKRMFPGKINHPAIKGYLQYWIKPIYST